MAQLTVSQSFDYRGGAAETQIDKIAFANPVGSTATAQFGSDQFGPGLISTAVAIQGSAGTHAIQIHMSAGASSFSAATWAFQSWSPADQLSIFGNGGANTITGSSQSDAIWTGGGVDTVFSGADADTVNLNGAVATGTLIDGGSARDHLVLKQSGLSDLTGTTLNNIEILDLIEDNQVARLAGSHFGAGKFDTVNGIAGSTHLQVYGPSADLSAVEFNYWTPGNTITITGSGSAATNLVGSSQNDTIIGSNLARNTMTGGLGVDILEGGAFDDTFSFASSQEIADGEAIKGGSGIDTIRLDAADSYYFSGVQIEDIDAVEFKAEASIALDDNVFGTTARPFAITGSAGINHVHIDAADSSIDLSQLTFTNWIEGEDELVITASDEIATTIVGSSQGDVFFLAAGDKASGGIGDDVYVLYTADPVVTENANQGTDALIAGTSYALQAGQSVEILLVNEEAGDLAISLTGNEIAQRLEGNAAANTLDGKGGADTMLGGLGNDTYIVDSAGDAVTEATGEGTDIVYAKTSYALSSNQSIETLQLDISTGTQPLNITGNNIGNVLIGNAGANVLNGGAGADLMQGGSGNDSYVVDNVGDVVKENNGGGTDTVVATVSYALLTGQYVETLQFGSAVGAASLNLTGNDLGNTIFGNGGSNALQGLGGADNIIGGGGRDIIAPGSDTAVDTIHFNAISDSTGGNRDQVLSADFNAEDKLVFAVKNIAYVGAVTVGALNNGANFNIEIGNAVNGLLNAGGAVEAVLFDPNSGGLNQAGHTYLVVDANNDGSYTANADYLVELVNSTGTLDATDFI